MQNDNDKEFFPPKKKQHEDETTLRQEVKNFQVFNNDNNRDECA